MLVFSAEVPGIVNRMNRALRDLDPRPRVVDEYDPLLAWLRAALAKLPQYAGVVYRALRSKDDTAGLAYTVGQSVYWPAFTSASTALNSELLEDFGFDRASQEAGVLLVADVSGARVLGPLTFFPNEAEVLLRPAWRGVVRCGVTNPALSAHLGIDVSKHTILELQQKGLPLRHGLVASAARHRYESLLAKDESDDEARALYAQLLDTEYREYDVARREYENVQPARLPSPRKRAHYHCAYGALLHLRFRESAAAREQFEAGLRIDASLVAARGAFAMVLQDLGDFDAARAHFLAVLRADPGQARYRGAYALMLYAH